MTIERVKQLQPGDQVFWSDPDDGLCSRYCTIQSIEVIDEDEETVRITDSKGEIECFARELF